MAGTDDVDEVEVVVASEEVKMGIYKCQAWTCTPVSEQSESIYKFLYMI